MTQVHHEITSITIHVCMVATGVMHCHICWVNNQNAKNILYIVISELVTLQGLTFRPKYSIMHYTWQLAQCYTLWIIQAQNLTFHNQIHNLLEKRILAIYNT